MAKKARSVRPATIAMPRSMNESVRIRKIENGFLVTHCTDGPGGYKEREVYSPTKPDLAGALKGAKK